MAFNPLVILVVLAVMGTTIISGILFLFLVLNVNIVQILKDLGSNQKTNNSLEKIEDYLMVEDISPAKTTIIRLPQYDNYEFQINRFVRCSNGAIYLMQDNDVMYMLNNISELVLDDGVSSLRGDDYAIYRVENDTYKAYVQDRLTYNQQNLSRYKKMLKESFEDNKELLKSTSEIVKESRKSLYSQGSQQQPWNPLQRRPLLDLEQNSTDDF